MKLEAGMYVRTQNGLISKIQGINEYSIALKNTCCERLGDKYFTFPNEEKIYEISKSSFNPIDLIEVRDVIVFKKDNRKYEITNIRVYEDMGTCLESKFSLNGNSYIFEFGKNDIKSIVTKEQFKANEYIVKE